MEGDALECFLKYDEQRIKSLELSALRQMSPLIDKKHKEVSSHLEKLEAEGNRIKQILAGIELKKSELEKLFDKRKHIYEKLSVRESKAQQELDKINIMYPIYQFQINDFLEETHKLADNDIDTSRNELNAEPYLGEHRQKLEEKVKDEQCVIDDFVKKYLY